MPQGGLEQRRVAIGEPHEASLQHLVDRPMLVRHAAATLAHSIGVNVRATGIPRSPTAPADRDAELA